jgi:hypothetical protein
MGIAMRGLYPFANPEAIKPVKPFCGEGTRVESKEYAAADLRLRGTTLCVVEVVEGKVALF